MTSIVCTLFEGRYHYGVAALVNSLYKQGYRGVVYAGFRGALPDWANAAKDSSLLQYPGSRILDVAEGLQIHFIHLSTSYHLTNYKPDFMLQLWQEVSSEAENLFYFDPDIVLVAPWSYIEEWANCGIALCEDVKSPLEKYHPRRIGWKTYYEKYGENLIFKNSIYVNGGFVGLNKKNIQFLKKWQDLQVYMEDLVGSLSKSSITEHTKLDDKISTEFFPFSTTDQDALNATIEACDLPISYMHQEAMALKPGSPILMPHALGKPKPWNYKPLQSMLEGKGPRLVDKQYWSNVEYPIQCYSTAKIRNMSYAMKISSLVNRFYSKANSF